LTATPAFGGIELSWTLPLVFPYAVAHVLIYRGLSDDFNGAVFIAAAGGNRYYDKLDSNLRYYYWIRIVSVNGTIGEPIGPASAVARPLIEQVIEGLTGQIDAGLLAQTLKQEIDRIDLLDQAITNETLVRANESEALSQALFQVQAGVDEVYGLFNQEIIARQTGQSALASAIDTVQTSVGANLSSVQVTLQSNIDTVAGQVVNIGALYTAQVSVNGLVGGFGIYNDGTQVEAGFDVDRFWIGRTSEDRRKPFIIDNGTVYIDEGVINSLTFSKLRDESGNFLVQDGKVRAQYLETEDVFVNGMISSTTYVPGVSGWMLNRNGTAQIGSFNVGLDFIESTGYVLGSSGWRLNQNGTAEFNSATYRGSMQSTNYVAGTTGWRIDSETGVAEFNELQANAQVTVGAMNEAINGGVSTGGRVEIQPNKIMVFDGQGTLRVKMGYLL
jgi:hypothetical protein